MKRKNPHNENINGDAYCYGANFEKRARREHFEKYEALTASLSDTIVDRVRRHLGYSKEELYALFVEDRNLNNIQLRIWDLLHGQIPKAKSLSDTVCMAKHITVYRILDVEPPPEEWKNLPDEDVDNYLRPPGR